MQDSIFTKRNLIIFLIVVLVFVVLLRIFSNQPTPQSTNSSEIENETINELINEGFDGNLENPQPLQDDDYSQYLLDPTTQPDPLLKSCCSSQCNIPIYSNPDQNECIYGIKDPNATCNGLNCARCRLVSKNWELNYIAKGKWPFRNSSCDIKDPNTTCNTSDCTRCRTIDKNRKANSINLG